MSIQPKKQRSRIYTVLDIVAVLIIFVMAFATGLGLMKLIYGAELLPTYQQTIDATVNATDQTQGYMIDQYVANIKEQVCPTLHTDIDVKYCFDI